VSRQSLAEALQGVLVRNERRAAKLTRLEQVVGLLYVPRRKVEGADQRDLVLVKTARGEARHGPVGASAEEHHLTAAALQSRALFPDLILPRALKDNVRTAPPV
jgi:hypothetical protein